ncbi:MAG: hypothetical protein ACKVOK_01945 [Flavobacteriales bacterium]
MRSLAILSFLLFQLNAYCQTEPVQVLFEQSLLEQGDSLHFSIWSNTSEPLEVTVLSNDFLGMQQHVQIAYSTMPFHLDTHLFPTGKYFILVTGNGIHIEKEFTIWKPE